MDRMHIIKEINMKIIIIIIIILLPNLYRYSKVIILFRNKSKGGIQGGFILLFAFSIDWNKFDII